MKRLNWFLGFVLAAIVGTAFAQVYLRPLDNRYGKSAGVSYYGPDTLPTGNSGEVGVQLESDGTASLMVYEATNDGITNRWGNIAGLDKNRPYTVFREDFDFVVARLEEEDGTAAVTTDGGENVIDFDNGQLGVVAYRLEAPDGPGLAATLAPFDVRGTLSLDTFADDVANEGVELVFGARGPDQVAGVHDAVWFDEDRGTASYCEIEIDIADISDLDDLWFGWIVKEAYDNPPASDSFDTSALFVISDAAGDLDIETELNGGGTLNDDTGVTWADGDSFVLRVVIAADTVSFYMSDANDTVLSAVTQTNAVLNADNGDEAVCVLGYTIAAASDPTVTVDYVEIGDEQ